MKKMYEKPEADKIVFHYRDQVVAASGGESGGGNSFVENSFGIAFICGGGGLVDRVFDYAGSILCA